MISSCPKNAADYKVQLMYVQELHCVAAGAETKQKHSICQFHIFLLLCRKRAERRAVARGAG